MTDKEKTIKKKDKKEEAVEAAETEAPPEDLIPKAPPRLAAQGIRTFTVARRADESGVSGTGVVIEGVVLATGQCIVHRQNRGVLREKSECLRDNET